MQMETNNTKSTSYNEDDEAWLYGGTNDDDGNDNLDVNQDDHHYQQQQQQQANTMSTGENEKNADDEDIYNITNKVSTLLDSAGEDYMSTAINDKVIGVTSDNDIEQDESDVNKNDDENGNNDNDRDDNDDDDDDDDDRINVVIDLKKPFNGAQSPTRQTSSKTNQVIINNLTGQATKNATVKGVDLDAQGTINDVPTYDFDLQSIKDEDKPWRKPGADITDYFNYGFTEESWIGYCAKQKRLRSEIMTNKMLINPSGHPFMGGQSMVPQMGMNQPQMMGNLSQQNGGLVMQQPLHYGIQNKMPFIRPAPMQMIGQQQQQQPPQQPRKIGVIDVIGTTDSTSRRQQYDMDSINPIGVVGSQSQIPDMSAPPPGWQTQIRLPQQQQQPRMPIIFQNPFSQYGPQSMQMDRQPFPQNPAPFMQPPQFLRHQQQQWEKPITVDSSQYFNEPTSPKSRTRSPTPNKSPTHSKSPKEDKYKHRSSEFTRGSDYRNRSPSPRRYRSHHYDRDRRRDRSRSRSRSRSRDDKYKRSRRRSDTDDDHRSSSKSHKRSKKSRRNGRDSNERRSRDRSSSRTKYTNENQNTDSTTTNPSKPADTQTAIKTE